MKNILLKAGYLVLLSGTIFSADVTGQAFLKTQGGDVKTCAGNEVYLEPNKSDGWVSTLLFSDLSWRLVTMLAVHSDKQKKLGFDTTEIKKELEIEGAKWEETYTKHLRSSKQSVLVTICDSQGNFEFNNIKDGKYVIATRVEWKVGDEKQGGILGDFITINQQKQKIILTK